MQQSSQRLTNAWWIFEELQLECKRLQHATVFHNGYLANCSWRDGEFAAIAARHCREYPLFKSSFFTAVITSMCSRCFEKNKNIIDVINGEF